MGGAKEEAEAEFPIFGIEGDAAPFTIDGVVPTEDAGVIAFISFPDGDDVDDADDAFRVIFGRWDSDDLDLQDGGGGQGLQDVRRVVGHEGGGFAVEEDKEVIAALQLDLVHSVDGDHGDFAEHFEGVVGFAFRVGLNVVAEAVDLLVDGGPESGDDGFLQLGGSSYGIDRLRVKGEFWDSGRRGYFGETGMISKVLCTGVKADKKEEGQ